MGELVYRDAIGVGQSRLAVAPGGRAYLTSHIEAINRPNNLVFVDTTTGRSTLLFPAPSSGLFTGIAMHAGRAYVSTVSGQDGQITVLDTATNRRDGDPISLGTGGPSGIAISPNGLAYVTDAGRLLIHVVDLARRQKVDTIPLTSSMGRGVRIALSANGARVYVATMVLPDTGLPHKLAIIDTQSKSPVVAPIDIGRMPVDVVVSASGDLVYCVNRESGSVTRVRADGQGATVIAVGPTPAGLAVSGSRIFVTDRDTDTLRAVTDAGAQTASAPVPDKPSGIAVTADGKRVLIAVDREPPVFFLNQPAVTLLDPTDGVAGAKVTVTGTDLLGPTAVKFGEVDAPDFTAVSAEKLEVLVPEGGSGTVDVTVEAIGGISVGNAASKFTHLQVPRVTGLNPPQGKAGQKVTVSGTDLSDPTEVQFGGIDARSFRSLSAQELEATAPEGVSGTVDVTVRTRSGLSVANAASKFAFLRSPVVTGLTPQQGKAGQKVTVSGTDLSSPLEVLFGTTPGEGLVPVSANTLQVDAPQGVVGTVDVTVRTAGGTSRATAASTFTILPVPRLTALSKRQGRVNDSLNVSGFDLGEEDQRTFFFGDTPAGHGEDVDPGVKVRLTVPAGPSGQVDVTVVTDGGPSLPSAQCTFTYLTGPEPVDPPLPLVRRVIRWLGRG